ncbi:hypothetical protein KI688_007221 [Linnemannia hyalina]|uniref:Uncharacterized protein n=1 Tax=Linnemannia hyalina TaxID=64524 RepID=A0A9P7XHY2_9FUNG|nr:hypothetical protein KI688_007221 [Linnemannia hyalina]
MFIRPPSAPFGANFSDALEALATKLQDPFHHKSLYLPAETQEILLQQHADRLIALKQRVEACDSSEYNSKFDRRIA